MRRAVQVGTRGERCRSLEVMAVREGVLWGGYERRPVPGELAGRPQQESQEGLQCVTLAGTRKVRKKLKSRWVKVKQLFNSDHSCLEKRLLLYVSMTRLGRYGGLEVGSGDG